MKRLLIPLALLALAAPSSALAGGWATAGLSPPDGGVGAGDTWNAQVNILQHGQTPLSGVSPTVTIRNTSTGEAKTFDAKPTDEAGVYVAKVVFPSEGKWSYEVYDGFTQYGGAKTHTFAAVDIGTGGGGSLPAFGIIGIVGLALGAIVFFYWLSRRVRVRAPAPAS
jgi:YtkA-like